VSLALSFAAFAGGADAMVRQHKGAAIHAESSRGDSAVLMPEKRTRAVFAVFGFRASLDRAISLHGGATSLMYTLKVFANIT
jgi:hypothetical protein